MFFIDCKIVRGLLSKFDTESGSEPQPSYDKLQEMYGHARIELFECKDKIQKLENKLTALTKTTDLANDIKGKSSSVKSRETLMGLFADWLETDDLKKTDEITDAEVKLRSLVHQLLEL